MRAELILYIVCLVIQIYVVFHIMMNFPVVSDLVLYGAGMVGWWYIIGRIGELRSRYREIE